MRQDSSKAGAARFNEGGVSCELSAERPGGRSAILFSGYFFFLVPAFFAAGFGAGQPSMLFRSTSNVIMNGSA